MIRCIVNKCFWKATSINSLYEHLNRVHSSISLYVCNYEGCSRNFSVRASFFRHFKKHYEEVSWRNINSQQERKLTNELHFPSESEKTSEQKVQSDSVEITSNEEIEINANEPIEKNNIIDFDELSNRLRLMSLNFNLKWLNTNTLPRSTVFEMQKDVRTSILKPCEEIVTNMETTGYISSASGTMLKKMFDVFTGVETEYKLLQELKASDLFKDAREFIISDVLQAGIVNNQQQLINDRISGEFLAKYIF